MRGAVRRCERLRLTWGSVIAHQGDTRAFGHLADGSGWVRTVRGHENMTAIDNRFLAMFEAQTRTGPIAERLIGVALGVGVLEVEERIRGAEHPRGVGSIPGPIPTNKPVTRIPVEEIEISICLGRRLRSFCLLL